MNATRQYTASMVTVPPQIEKNDNPTGPHDLLIGSASHFYNQLLSAIGLNLTIRSHFEVGSCIKMLTENCTGLRTDLQFGISDFSVIALPANDYDPRVEIPVINGPFLYDAFIRFGGMPNSDSKVSEIDALFTLTQIPDALYIVAVVALLISCILINWSPIRASFKSRIKWVTVVCIMTMHGHPTPPIMIRRRLALLTCVLTAFFFYQIYQASSTCDRLSVTPPHYLFTVDEVADSNRTALLFKGHMTYLKYKDHENERYRHIVESAILYDASQTDTFNRIAMAVIGAEKGISFGNLIVVGVIQCFICFNTEYSKSNLIRFGKPYMHSLGYATYKQGIDPWLRARLDNIYYRFAEAGLYEEHNSDPIPSVSSIMNPEKLLMCLTAMNLKADDDVRVDMMPLSSFRVVIKGALLAALLAFLAFLCEMCLSKCRLELAPRQTGLEDGMRRRYHQELRF